MIAPVPPDGSVIQAIPQPDGVVLRWSNPAGTVVRYLVAIFLLCWLVGWCSGEIAVFHQLLTHRSGAPVIFPIFFLCFWTLGGALALLIFVKSVSPTRPETLQLSPSLLVHDPGSESPTSLLNMLRFRGLFHRTTPVTVPRDAVQNIRLERIYNRQRLSFDVGMDRIEVGRDLRGPEREWLHGLLLAWKENPMW